MPTDKTGSDEKLGHILKTAAGIFARKGYHRASIRDISRATGVSLSGLYYYVSSKEELLFLIQDHCFGTILENLDRLLRGVEDPGRKLRLLIENHLRFFASNMPEMKVLSHEARTLSGDYRKRVNELKVRYTEICSGILRDLNPEPPVPLRVATFSLFGMMNWIYNWYRPERDVPVEELTEQMSRLFLRGFLPGESGSEDVPPGARDGLPSRDHPSIWRH